MNINNVNQLFNQKIQDINSRLPKETNVSNKFQSLLEQAQLKNTTETSEPTQPSDTTTSSNADINSLLKTMLSTQTLLNSTSFSSDSSSSIFPTSTFNNTINTLQQTQLLNALTKKSSTNNEK